MSLHSPFAIFAIEKTVEVMNIYEIGKRDLGNRKFAFSGVASFLGKDFSTQSFIFEGFVFNVCLKGSARIRIDYKEHLISGNDIFVILPKHIFSVLEYSADFDVRILLIPFDFMYHLPIAPDLDLLKNIDVCPCARMDDGVRDDIQKIYSIIERYNNNEGLSCQIQDTLTLSLVLITASLFDNVVPNGKQSFSRQENITRSFFDLLIRYHIKERSVSFYAGKLCITPKYLTMAVKSVTNHSVQKWINEIMLIEAKWHIRTTELTIQQISDKLNFPTSSSFVRFFRTNTGQTPLDYRKKAGT